MTVPKIAHMRAEAASAVFVHEGECTTLSEKTLRIPRDADQRSELMSITVPK
jgi:hypothetical protein